jgi:hypothetical protein
VSRQLYLGGLAMAVVFGLLGYAFVDAGHRRSAFMRDCETRQTFTQCSESWQKTQGQPKGEP